MNDGHVHDELHRVGLAQALVVEVPPRALEVHVLDVDTLFGIRSDLLLGRVHDAVLEGEGIDRDCVFPRRRLQHGGEEARRVGEPREPVHPRVAVLDPPVDLLEAHE